MIAPSENPATPESTPRAFTTRDGQHLSLRRVTQDDTAPLVDLLLRLSHRTIRYRYFASRDFSLDGAWREAERSARGHAGAQITVVATVPQPSGDELIAVAELIPDSPLPVAGELAIVVRDDRQGVGIGAALMRLLLEYARAYGVSSVRADLLAENRAVWRLLSGLGLPFESRTRWGETSAIVRLDAPAEGLAP